MSEKIFVTRSSMPSLEEYVEEIRDIWDTHWLTNMGAKHEALRAGIADYLGAEGLEHVQLFTNGHMSIELSLQALGLPEGSEVITTPFSFSSTTHAIVRNNLKPVFCDIREDDCTIDASKIERLITGRTSAILPVHVYGNMAEVDEIQSIADRHGLKVIYDAAHAFGVTYKGRGAACFGDVSCFSFHATKVFNSIEGGAAVYRDVQLGRKLFYLKNFGISDEDHVNDVGANAKMNEFCAAMGLCNLRHVDEDIRGRAAVEERYREHLEGIPGIRLKAIQKDVKTNHAYFPVRFDRKVFGADRNQVAEALKKEGIYARKYFYPLISDYACYRESFNSAQTPVAQRISSEVLTLPMYPELGMAQVDRICRLVKSNSSALSQMMSDFGSCGDET